MKLIPNQINIIYEYALWLAEHPVPCDECISKQDSVICDGCDQQLDWIKSRSHAKTVFKNLIGCDLAINSDVQKIIHLYVKRIRLESELNHVKTALEDNAENLKCALKAFEEKEN